MRGDSVTARKRIALLPQQDIEQLLFIYDDALRRSIPLSSVVSLIANGKTAASPKISVVATEMETAKRKAGRANDYLKSLNQIIKQFSKGRERMPIDQFTVKDVESYLESKNIQSRATLRSRLSTLFEFAIRRGYRADNPCSRLEAITHTPEPPSVMTAKEVEKALKWLVLNPRSLAWFALTTFAGLRPEEAQNTRWKDVHIDEGWIKVEAQTTKVRQRRVVYPLPVALDWLKRAKKMKSELPLSPKKQLKDRKLLRRVLGWNEWKQDVTRHTAASYWLAQCGSVSTVATALGHSEAILRKNYMALVTRAQAEEFWKVVKSFYA